MNSMLPELATKLQEFLAICSSVANLLSFAEFLIGLSVAREIPCSNDSLKRCNSPLAGVLCKTPGIFCSTDILERF